MMMFMGARLTWVIVYIILQDIIMFSRSFSYLVHISRDCMMSQAGRQADIPIGRQLGRQACWQGENRDSE